MPRLRRRGVAVREGVRAAALTDAGRMRLLANENVPGPVVAALRAAGHDVHAGESGHVPAYSPDPPARGRAINPQLGRK